MNSNTIASSFSRLSEKLRLDIYSNTPDPAILPFIRNNFPYLLKRPEPSGWTVYSSEQIESPKLIIKSVHLARHPFLIAEHSGADIEFLTQQWKNGSEANQQIRIWLHFGNRTQAEAVQAFLVGEFQKLGAYNRTEVTNDEITVMLFPNQDLDGWNSLSIILKNQVGASYSLLVLFDGDDGAMWLDCA